MEEDEEPIDSKNTRIDEHIERYSDEENSEEENIGEEVYDEEYTSGEEKPPETLTKEIRSEDIEVNNTDNIERWYKKQGWKENPFTFSIIPDLFVGYYEQSNSILRIIKEKHKLSFVLGPTGSGKTMLLKWIAQNLPKNYDFIYIGKPPESPEGFVDILNEKYKKPWPLSIFFPHIKNIYQMQNFLSKKLKNKNLVFLCDEVHEAETEILEWLRVFCDIDNVIMILSGLPILEQQLNEKLNTFAKRATAKIELISLTKEETKELIKKRIESVGGKEYAPFTEAALDAIYEQTGGFPREVIRLANDFVNDSIEKNLDVVDVRVLVRKERKEEKDKISLGMFAEMSPLQEKIIELLNKKSCSPGEIADTFNLEKYKSRQHAVRSVNNILIRMMQEGIVIRKKKGKAFVYMLAPRVRTIAVKS